LQIDETKGRLSKKSSLTKFQSSSVSYIQNTSIIEKSNQILGNGTAFLSQDQQPAIKLLSLLQIDKTKGPTCKNNLLPPSLNVAPANTYEKLEL
jgi:hypothetical protein